MSLATAVLDAPAASPLPSTLEDDQKPAALAGWLGVILLAAVYVLSFFAVGVASDFRYAYWAVLAGIVGSVVAALGRPEPQMP